MTATPEPTQHPFRRPLTYADVEQITSSLTSASSPSEGSNSPESATSPSTSPTTDDDVAALIEADREKKQLIEEAEYELHKRAVRRLADALERKDARKPIQRSLSEELALPDEAQLYSINELLPLGGNALFAGRYKAGKTTFNGQLLKAWADGVPFLGRFACHPEPARPVVTIFNYEMSEGQFRRWLRRVGIENTHRVHVVHLRGISLPLAIHDVRTEVAGWLRDAGAGLWIVDPASRAMAGFGDGNSNADVSLWLSWLDEIKMEAGVRDLVLNIHMGHAAATQKDAARAIGAQAWSAWADALWRLEREEDKAGNVTRWFSAEGRDVDLDKLLVSYTAEDMSIALVDTDMATHNDAQLRAGIIRVIDQNPGITQAQIPHELRGLKLNTRKQDVIEELEDLVDQGVIVLRKGARNASCHYPAKHFEPLD